LRWTTARFGELGIADARLDAEHLLAFALGCTRMRLYTEHDRLVDDDARARFRECVRRRMAREPVAQIEGKRGFHALDLELHVDRRVLVPRPETEHLVDWLLEDLGHEPAVVIDVGTGSGAIALAIKRARPQAEVHAVDISDDALAVATANAERSGLAVTFARSDLLEAVAPPPGGWRAIAANLPYIPTDVIATLEPEVRVFEPRLALDGGPDGLQLIERLLAQVLAPGVLAPEGAVYLEVGFDQARRVADAVTRLGWSASTRNDLSGIERIVRARPVPANASPR
jgi:release factor glutamine methyltransferase